MTRSSLAKDHWFLVFLSQVLPGLGQLYQGQYGLALIFFALTLMSLTLLAGQLGLILGIPALASFAVFQLCAAAGSSRLSEGRFLQRVGAQMALLVFVGRSLFFAAVPLSRQIVEPFSVPSESMFPTLMVGDRILVRKRHNYQPKPGDIIVFRAPSLLPDPSQLGASSSPGKSMASAQPTRDPEEFPGEFFVKRVVGKGGDRIQVQAGQTFRNGQALTEPYINEPPQYSWDSEAIAHNRLIVLGDNRNASFDSSRWGSLPRANVVGRAYRISWPPERSSPLP
ncbi:MAG: signal peptidase I [Synechococcales cyanobacterium RU_4_20]|nr:signal peptidase I [Synechococcales cyanobacterium RU_4_20]